MHSVIPIGSWHRPSVEDVQTEIGELWLLLRVLAPFSKEGEENEEAIEAQLSVLSERLTPRQIHVEFSAERAEAYLLRAALRAGTWLCGTGEKPSTEWSRLVLR